MTLKFGLKLSLKPNSSLRFQKKKKRSADDFQTFLTEYLQDKKAKREQCEEERKEERRQQFELEKAKLDLLSKILKEQ